MAHSTDEKIEIIRRGVLAEFFGCVEARCESPMERLFFWALMSECGSQFHRIVNDSAACEAFARAGAPPTAVLIGSYAAAEPPGGSSFWFLQWAAPPYRLDLAVVVLHVDGHVDRIDVEIDGHDFHEKTKAQARRDKSRDRFLVQRGWRVTRFTGQEVYEAPGVCVASTMSLVDALVSQRGAATR